jgi:hypothetical protein
VKRALVLVAACWRGDPPAPVAPTTKPAIADSCWVLPDGEYVFWIGPNAVEATEATDHNPGARCRTSYTARGQQRIECHQQTPPTVLRGTLRFAGEAVHIDADVTCAGRPCGERLTAELHYTHVGVWQGWLADASGKRYFLAGFEHVEKDRFAREAEELMHREQAGEDITAATARLVEGRCPI